MFEVKLYGEVVPYQSKSDTVISLHTLQRQLKDANGEDLLVRINSVGGDVEEGFALYSELRRYAKTHKAHITTLAEGRCASIATVFFLAGDTRIITEHTEPFVHNAWTKAEGDSQELQKISSGLEKWNDKIAQHYAKHTNLSYQQARRMMREQTAITPQVALKYRFATHIEPSNKPLNLIKNRYMNKKTSLVGGFKRFLAFIGIQNKIVFDAENNEIDFYELEEADTVEVGAKANINGEPATGEVVIATGETYVFDAGILVEIRPTQSEEVTETVEELEAENKHLKQQINELRILLNRAEQRVQSWQKALNGGKSQHPNTLKKTNAKQELTVSQKIELWKKNKMK